MIAIKYMEGESKQDILEAIRSFAEQVDRRFDGIDGRLDGIDGRLDGIDGRLDGIDGRLNGIDFEISSIKNQMVTKSYLDDKLANLKGDMIFFVRSEDAKLFAKLTT